MEFQRFPKIQRMHAPCVITEKIDGTNAQLLVTEYACEGDFEDHPGIISVIENNSLMAGSRTRWLQPGKQTDNHGFARWATEHAERLINLLGPGRHYGEWWGAGINRKYGLTEKRFTSFRAVEDPSGLVHDLPYLYEGMFAPERAYEALMQLKNEGSHAAPGFMQPEGIVVYFPQTQRAIKLTFDSLTDFEHVVYSGSGSHWTVIPRDYHKGKADASKS